MTKPIQKNSYSKDELLACGRGEMFGEGNAQLPLPPMLMFDRIVSITSEGGKYGQGQIIAELDIKPDLWFFECHFTDDPVMPVSYTHLDVYKRQCHLRSYFERCPQSTNKYKYCA